MPCSNCNVEVPAGAAYCPKCGAQLGAAAAGAGASGVEKLRGAQMAAAANTEPETELWHGRYSPKAMYGSWLLAAAATVAAGVASALFPLPITWLAAGVVVGGLWLVLLANFLIARFSVDYRLTTQRLVHKSGILRQVTNRIEVIDIDDVTYVQGIIERLFNVGTVNLRSSDSSHPELALRGIEGVQDVATMIDNARREERRKRGLYMEAV